MEKAATPRAQRMEKGKVDPGVPVEAFGKTKDPFANSPEARETGLAEGDNKARTLHELAEAIRRQTGFDPKKMVAYKKAVESIEESE